MQTKEWEKEAQKLVSMPYLNPPLNEIKGSDVKDVWDWQIKEVLSLCTRAYQEGYAEALKEVEEKLNKEHKGLVNMELFLSIIKSLTPKV